MVLAKNVTAALISMTGVDRAFDFTWRSPRFVVLNYHRVGDARLTPYDPGVFSCSADALYQQLAMCRKNFAVIDLDEAIEIVNGRRFSGLCVLVTFDDGYRDSYEVAAPILRTLGVPAVFFLTTAFLDNSIVPWWDSIAYIVRNARRSGVRLTYPFELPIDGRDAVELRIRAVLQHFKLPATVDAERFISELETACDCARPTRVDDLFMTWDQATRLADDGIAVGAHTVTHPILSKLPLERQRAELVESKARLQDRLRVSIRACSYPVGRTTAFSPDTKRLARQAGYDAAFSHYGGTNRPGQMDPYDVRRNPVDAVPRSRLRVALAASGLTSAWF